MGLRLRNPLIAGASPLSRDVRTVKRLADAGIGAVVLYSLFEEQIAHEAERHEHFAEFAADTFHEALTFAPRLDYFPRGPQDYVDHVRQVKDAVDIPIIASLNGATTGGWLEYARMLQDAGADGIELNLYHIETDPTVSPAEVEQRYLDVVSLTKDRVSIPVALKLSPFFTSLPHLARRLEQAGVDALVLFNRFYQPDIDLEALDVLPDLTLSAPHEMRLPLRWIAILDAVLETSLAASTGVYTAEDVIKLTMAGADATMLCAALLRNGPSLVPRLLDGMASWLHEHEYESLHQTHGCMNHRTCADPAAFERANYMKAIHSYR